MQYVTSVPAAVQVATVPALPKSTSSGWARTHSARSTCSAGEEGRSNGELTRRTLGPGRGHPGELVRVEHHQRLLHPPIVDDQRGGHDRTVLGGDHDAWGAVDLGEPDGEPRPGEPVGRDGDQEAGRLVGTDDRA